ncbi:MAG: hypothetical protein K2R98_33040 [Gemmataceae bacterium]|nr:hypothetical protein [Gemmataceae bacterium]
MAATHTQSTTSTPVLYLAFDLGWTEWKLAFSTAPAEPARLRTIRARDLTALEQEIAKARQRWGLPDDVPVRSCYEAGRDGFWLHRWLLQRGIDNQVVDASSIEVNRRARRAKSDRLDAAKLLQQLQRYHGGEQKVWSVVNVPAVPDEDRRQLHRDLLEMKADRTRHSNRIKGLLAGCGLEAEVNDKFEALLPTLRTWDDQPVAAELQRRLLREHQRWQFVHQQIKDVENERARRIRTEKSPLRDKCRAAGVPFYFKQANGRHPGMDAMLDGQCYEEMSPVPSAPLPLFNEPAPAA